MLPAYLHATLPPWLARLLFPESNHLRTLLVGSADSLKELDGRISSRGHTGIRPVGFLADEQPVHGSRAMPPYLGKVSGLAQVMQTEPLEDPVNRAANRMLDIAVSPPVCLFIMPPLCLLVGFMHRQQAPGPLFFNRPR